MKSGYTEQLERNGGIRKAARLITRGALRWKTPKNEATGWRAGPLPEKFGPAALRRGGKGALNKVLR